MTKTRKTLTAIGPNGSEVYHPTLRRNCCDLGRVVNYLFAPSAAVIC